MKKKICQALAYWLVLAVILGITAFWTGYVIVWTGMMLWLCIPWISMAVNLYLKKQIQISISLPVTLEKKEEAAVTITVHNSSHLPYARMYCEITVENQLTQEKVPLLFRIQGGTAEETDTVLDLMSEHCGYLHAYPSAVWLTDWIGFLPVRCRNVEQKFQNSAGERKGTAVLPDTFHPHIYMDMVQNMREDAENWSQIQKGNDASEVFALRDYVPGDSLKQIHWKLSSKRGQLIVRDASFPVEKSLLLFWDKNTAETEPEEMDAMAECAASVSQEILNLGYRFTLGWTEGRGIAFEQIEAEEDLLRAIPQMVKHGPDRTGETALYEETFGTAGRFGKVIYLAKTPGEQKEYFAGADMTYLLCDENVIGDDCSVISFRAEHYREDLAAFEL